jgi:hypothetical protein
MILDTVALVVTAAASIVAAFAAVQARNHVQQVHLLINSRMDQLLITTKEMATAAGVAQGIASMTEPQPDAPASS